MRNSQGQEYSWKVSALGFVPPLRCHPPSATEALAWPFVEQLYLDQPCITELKLPVNHSCSEKGIAMGTPSQLQTVGYGRM
jgi:hypothetical protein